MLGPEVLSFCRGGGGGVIVLCLHWRESAIGGSLQSLRQQLCCDCVVWTVVVLGNEIVSKRGFRCHGVSVTTA